MTEGSATTTTRDSTRWCTASSGGGVFPSRRLDDLDDDNCTDNTLRRLRHPLPSTRVRTSTVTEGSNHPWRSIMLGSFFDIRSGSKSG
ncbi:hypothetical protein M6B38_369900 [Iris pallida]|uniref:Uncharacterized protein n=1 Tax=Iris pallida TaxID=29817 RepID=A0AAX6GFF4_IRIPA|nr:hypothetical protein M6B38_369900 [Iris pallida]